MTVAPCARGRYCLAAALALAALAGCASQPATADQPSTIDQPTAAGPSRTAHATAHSKASSSAAGWQGTPGEPWKCRTGYIDLVGANGVQVGSDNTGAAQSAPFHPGPPPPSDKRAPAAAYALTVANRASANAVITGFVVVLYNQAGTEIGQSSAAFGGQYITPGQQWTWVESSNASLDGQVGNDLLPSGDTTSFPEAATCRVVSWNPS